MGATANGAVLRYPGGKFRVREQLAPFFPSGSHIYSGFLGGGHVELLLAETNHKITAFDSFSPLVNFWNTALAKAEEGAAISCQR